LERLVSPIAVMSLPHLRAHPAGHADSVKCGFIAEQDP
jgi:hypothetical protein